MISLDEWIKRIDNAMRFEAETETGSYRVESTPGTPLEPREAELLPLLAQFVIARELVRLNEKLDVMCRSGFKVGELNQPN